MITTPMAVAAKNDSRTTADFRGPPCQLVEERSAETFRPEDIGAQEKPLVVKKAVLAWEAWHRWSFERFAELRHPNGEAAVSRFPDGLVEQGATRPLPILPVGPFMHELAAASEVPVSADVGLLPESRRKKLALGQTFYLNWAHMQSFEPNRRYLADWPVLAQFPEMRNDFNIRTLWSNDRWTWEYAFVGPANTVTGFHQDIHDNWFCQIRGTKEVVLVPADQTPKMSVSKKYNLGSVLSNLNVSKLNVPSREADSFAKTHCYHARLEAGDALFIPKNTWHTVVSLAPSISLATFGLTTMEMLTAGAWAEFKNVLHLLRLYAWRNCVCHQSR
jgi:hypothetical protein